MYLKSLLCLVQGLLQRSNIYGYRIKVPSLPLDSVPLLEYRTADMDYASRMLYQIQSYYSNPE